MLALAALCAALAVVASSLTVKIILLRRSADELRRELSEKLDTDTNTLISLSTGDRHMKMLAADLNKQLRALRDERRRLQNGDAELKTAVTNIAHDLRTPLTAISGYLDLLEQEKKARRPGDISQLSKNAPRR